MGGSGLPVNKSALNVSNVGVNPTVDIAGWKLVLT